jgi:probable F420-dependent oxidoreductase
MDVSIGFHLVPQHGDMKDMRKAWMEAEELGVDSLYTADHFTAVIVDNDFATKNINGERGTTMRGKVFEATAIQAAMAVTTTRPKIGCIVHGNSYRNPNLLAHIANTIDHLSDGRFILGMGAGFLKADYDEFGYPFGTQTSRALDLARDVPIIKARIEELTPKPIGKIPIAIATMGEKIGMRIVAEHADIWHVYGPVDTVREKRDVLKRICGEVGRDFSEIQMMTSYIPEIFGGKDADPDLYLELGIQHFTVQAEGPRWDMGLLREMLAWRYALNQAKPSTSKTVLT